MKILIEPCGIIPTRAHPTDAGLDLKCPYDEILYPYESKLIDTFVHVELPHQTVGIVKNRSSMFVRGIITDGTIDEGYTGSIKVNLRNCTGDVLYIHRGDKIAQLVVLPVLYPRVEIVNDLAMTERGNGGFGSTGV